VASSSTIDLGDPRFQALQDVLHRIRRERSLVLQELI
jgi:hypothetical protein